MMYAGRRTGQKRAQDALEALKWGKPHLLTPQGRALSARSIRWGAKIIGWADAGYVQVDASGDLWRLVPHYSFADERVQVDFYIRTGLVVVDGEPWEGFGSTDRGLRPLRHACRIPQASHARS